MSRSRKLIGDLARYADQLLRRIPFLPLRSLEPVELSAALPMPHELVVVDRSRRVLAAVARDLPDARCHLCDIAAAPIPAQADVVIAFNIICRLASNADRGMEHLLAAVRPGGLLLIDDRSAEAHRAALAGFQPIAPKSWRKPRSSPQPPQS